MPILSSFWYPAYVLLLLLSLALDGKVTVTNIVFLEFESSSNSVLKKWKHAVLWNKNVSISFSMQQFPCDYNHMETWSITIC